MKTKAIILGLLLALSPLAGRVAMATPPAVSAGGFAPAPSLPTPPAPATRADVSSYAAREQHARAGLAKFEGGAQLVIGGSVLVIVLVVLLLVLIV